MNFTSSLPLRDGVCPDSRALRRRERSRLQCGPLHAKLAAYLDTAAARACACNRWGSGRPTALLGLVSEPADGRYLKRIFIHNFSGRFGRLELNLQTILACQLTVEQQAI